MYEDTANVMKSRINIPNRLKVIIEEYNLSQDHFTLRFTIQQ